MYGSCGSADSLDLRKCRLTGVLHADSHPVESKPTLYSFVKSNVIHTINTGTSLSCIKYAL